MRHILAALLLVLGFPALSARAANPADGTILVLYNSNKLVQAGTASTISHVAMVVNIQGRATVYEATPDKVRKLPLETYYAEIGELNHRRKRKMRLELREPARQFDREQRARLHAFLEEQLGRRYSIRGYVRKSPGDGIHCAALVGSALTDSGACEVVNPFGQNPASLMLGIRTLYGRGRIVALPTPAEPTLCERWQASWQGFKMWCSWSFVESFRFCF